MLTSIFVRTHLVRKVLESAGISAFSSRFFKALKRLRVTKVIADIALIRITGQETVAVANSFTR